MHSMLSYTEHCFGPTVLFRLSVIPMVARCCRGSNAPGMITPTCYLGAVALNEPAFSSCSSYRTQEVLWVSEERRPAIRSASGCGRRTRRRLSRRRTYVLRSEDLFLLFNVSGTGMAAGAPTDTMTH